MSSTKCARDSTSVNRHDAYTDACSSSACASAGGNMRPVSRVWPRSWRNSAMKARSSSARGSPTDVRSTLMNTSRRPSDRTALMWPYGLPQCLESRLDVQRRADGQCVFIHSDLRMVDRVVLPAVRLHPKKGKTPRDALLFPVKREILTRHQRIDRADVLCTHDAFRGMTSQLPARRVVHRRGIVHRKRHVCGAAIRGGNTFGDLLKASPHTGEPPFSFTP